MELGWRRLIPLSLGWMLLVAGFLVSPWWGLGMIVAIVIGGVILGRAFKLGSELELSDTAVLPPVAKRIVPPELVRDLSDRDEKDESGS